MTEEEQRALEAVRRWIQPGGPGVRVLKVLLAMAERGVGQRRGDNGGHHENG